MQEWTLMAEAVLGRAYEDDLSVVWARGFTSDEGQRAKIVGEVVGEFKREPVGRSYMPWRFELILTRGRRGGWLASELTLCRGARERRHYDAKELVE